LSLIDENVAWKWNNLNIDSKNRARKTYGLVRNSFHNRVCMEQSEALSFHLSTASNDMVTYDLSENYIRFG